METKNTHTQFESQPSRRREMEQQRKEDSSVIADLISEMERMIEEQNSISSFQEKKLPVIDLASLQTSGNPSTNDDSSEVAIVFSDIAVLQNPSSVPHIIPNNSSNDSIEQVSHTSSSVEVRLKLNELLDLLDDQVLTQTSENAETNIIPETSVEQKEVEMDIEKSPLNYHQIPFEEATETSSFEPEHIVDDTRFDAYSSIPKEKETTSSDAFHSEEYQKLWLERKSYLEKEAERKAKSTVKQWQREKLPLKKIIDDSLKEYIELYERAYALLLQFEFEKSEWTNKMRAVMITQLGDKTGTKHN
jgi:hypothetical protein